MKRPCCYTAEQVMSWTVSEEYEPGTWRAARPYNLGGFKLIWRLKLAWGVFTGKFDALKWNDEELAGRKTYEV